MTEQDSQSTDAANRTLGQIIRERREALSMTQEDVADAIGISQESVGKIELGKVQTPRNRTLRRLAEHLGLDIADLYLALGRADNRASAERLADASAFVADDDPLLDAIMLDVRSLTPESRQQVREMVTMIRRLEARDRDGGSET